MGALPAAGFGPVESLVTISVPESVAHDCAASGELELIDGEGVAMAALTVASTYPAPAGMVGLSGAITPLPGTISRAFAELYTPPASTGARDGLSVVVDSPLTISDIDEIENAARGRPVQFLVLAGTGSPAPLTPQALIRATIVAASTLPDCSIVAVPLARREDPAADQAFGRLVLTAYASSEMHSPGGEGDLSAAVRGIVEADQPEGAARGLVVFFTGLSGSGKSTIAQALRDRILENGVRTVTLLDGDRVRRRLSAGLSFSPTDRETNIERIGWVAAEISRHGGMAICSPIAPYEETRRTARAMTEAAGGRFFLIHVATALAECERRDRKGLYAKARHGKISDFTGISAPYETPKEAELTVDTTDRGSEEVLEEVLTMLIDSEALSPTSRLRWQALLRE